MRAALAGSGERVRRLAEIAGVSTAAGRSYDWDAIEADLGVGLPSDYKLMAESFPEGWFDEDYVEMWKLPGAFAKSGPMPLDTKFRLSPRLS